MKYIPTIGLEMHCEVKSNAKVFSSGRNCYDETPNINIAPLDMAFPGTLPVTNKECVKKAIMMSSILNCEIPDTLIFDRKNYYYPDLPKGYQITQSTKPIGINGNLLIDVDGEEKTVLIHDIHLEEDAASLDHFYDISLIDYNRSGVPLLEAVTEPCLHSAKEAVTFLETMRTIYKYCDISEADTKKGQIRCDVNVSLALPDAKELGTKVEIKNINSFSNVHDAIIYEIERQSELLDEGKGDLIEQETRRFDEETGTTIKMRSKVDAIDYKYFIEPNIPPFTITKTWIEEIKKEIPALAKERKEKYINKYGLSAYDAGVLVKERNIADYFEECIKLGLDPKTATNWITVQIIGYLNKENIELNSLYLTPQMLKQITDKIDDGTISSKQAKEIFFKVINEKKEPDAFISKDNAQINDETELLEIIANILSKNENQINEYKNGKTNLFDYFVGQVMKETRGKANPSKTKEILTKELNK